MKRRRKRKTSAKKVFVVYDERAFGGDTDDAQVLDVCNSEDEARRAMKGEGFLGVVYEYDEVGGELVNEKPRFDLNSGDER